MGMQIFNIFQLWIFENNLGKVWFLDILYRDIYVKLPKGYVLRIDLLEKIPIKLILYFLVFL
jgi:hypothetical protein